MSTNGVVIPQATIQDSEQKKRQHRTLARFKERAIGFRCLMEAKKDLTYLDCKRIEQVVNSYLGFCRRKRTYHYRKEMIALMGEIFWTYFYVQGHYESIHVKNKFKLNL